MPSMIPCPKCGEYSFHKSHTRNSYERFIKKVFRRRPYRCHDCGYRGWISSSALKPKLTLKQLMIYFGVFIIAIIFSMFIKDLLQ